MQDNEQLEGPYETEIIVHITDGKNEGKITVGLSMATCPTQEDINDSINHAKLTAEESGYRLMTKTEFFNVMMRERLGATNRFACPNGDEWDAVQEKTLE